VLAEEQALELVVAVLPSLGVNLRLHIGLGELLASSKRVGHALFHLDYSLDDIVFVEEVDVAEPSFSGLFQTFHVVFLDDVAAADLLDQPMQVRILQALPRLFIQTTVELELLVRYVFLLGSNSRLIRLV